MSEYQFVEKPFLDQLAALGCAVIEKRDLLSGRVRVPVAETEPAHA